MKFDPRTTPARPDVAALHLRGQVSAARFVAGTELEVRDAQAPLRREPSPDAPLDTEALHGERVMVYDENGEGWWWGQLCSDGYVGWVPANALRPPGPPPTHRVAVLRTFVFPGRSIKAPPVDALSLGSRVAVKTPQRDDPGDLTDLASGFCVPTRHLAPIESKEPDFVAVAERFVGVPYLWGGKTSLGIDCSGLAQAVYAARGITLPLYVGLAGPVERTRLLRMAAKAGASESARFLAGHVEWFLRFGTPGGYRPERLLARLGPTVTAPASGVAGLHLFTFNQVQQTEEWRRELLARAGAAQPA